MTGVLLAYGQAADGRMIPIADAERGIGCNCVCPECNRRLVAKKGNELAHHFAHEADAECAGAVESMLHKLAKQTIADAGHVWFPEIEARSRGQRKYIAGAGMFEAATVELESRVENIQPDAILTHRTGRQLAVEIHVTHTVTPDKSVRYRELELACIEIDLSAHHGPHRLKTQPDHLPDIILRTAPRWWVFSPRIVVAETLMMAEQEAADRTRALERAELEAARAAREIERIKLLTEDQRRDEAHRKAAQAAFVAEQAEWRRQEDERLAVAHEKWEQQERDRLATIAAHRAKVKAYRDGERVAAENLVADPRAWRFSVHLVAAKFLIQNRADEWMARPTAPRPGHSLHTWPFDELPDAAALDAIYDDLWAEIKQQGRYRGP